MLQFGSTSPFNYAPVVDNSIDKDNWERAQRAIVASECTNEIELEAMVKFDLIRWLGW